MKNLSCDDVLAVYKSLPHSQDILKLTINNARGLSGTILKYKMRWDVKR
jgi:hypothetical protein